MSEKSNEEVKKIIKSIGHDLIKRAEDISKDLDKCSSITIHAEINWDCVTNFDVTKNYYVFENDDEKQSEPKSNYEKVNKFIKKEFPDGIQAFNNRNIAGDLMTTIYIEDDVQIDYAEGYHYIEIFGLKFNEFKRLIEEGVIY